MRPIHEIGNDIATMSQDDMDHARMAALIEEFSAHPQSDPFEIHDIINQANDQLAEVLQTSASDWNGPDYVLSRLIRFIWEADSMLPPEQVIATLIDVMSYWGLQVVRRHCLAVIDQEKAP